MSIYKYYKKEKELRTFNSVKYYVMSLVLDILVRIVSFITLLATIVSIWCN